MKEKRKPGRKTRAGHKLSLRHILIKPGQKRVEQIPLYRQIGLPFDDDAELSQKPTHQ